MSSIIITLITFSTQKVKGNECISQICDVESSIIIRTQEKEYFVVQLFRGFTKEGEFVKKLLISKNRKDIVNIVLPSSEEVKNFKANIKKYRTGFILETLYGGGKIFTHVPSISSVLKVICSYTKLSAHTSFQTLIRS